MNAHNIGGNTTVIIKDFNTKEVITVINNVNRVEIGYENNNTLKQQTKNLLSFSSIYPSTVSFSATSINDGILNMLSTNRSVVEKEVYREETHYLDTVLGMNKIFLPQEVTSADIISFKKNGIQSAFEYDSELNAIINLELTKTYSVLYKIKTKVEQTVLEKQTHNYYTIEILNKGNIDNTGADILITIPKAGLSVSPVLTFDSVSLVNIPLTFNIADSIMTINTY